MSNSRVMRSSLANLRACESVTFPEFEGGGFFVRVHKGAISSYVLTTEAPIKFRTLADARRWAFKFRPDLREKVYAVHQPDAGGS